MDQRVNAKVFDIADGSKHLVFTIDGTDQCVGEIRYTGDPRYLIAVSQLFSKWANTQRSLPSAIRGIING
jgi:hypothetical protein